MTKKERYRKVIEYFKEHMPVVYSDPFQLLVAVILSAQCTDKRVNIITPPIFAEYPTAATMAKASPKELFEYIKSCSYPNNKAKHLQGMAKMLTNDFNGTVPRDIDELRKLPGVGRKTANVIAAVVFNKPVMPVDTHVFRVSAKIGLSTNTKTPLETEKQLTHYIPAHLILLAHHWLILHGRYICTARSPKCRDCGISEYCKYYKKTIKK